MVGILIGITFLLIIGFVGSELELQAKHQATQEKNKPNSDT